MLFSDVISSAFHQVKKYGLTNISKITCYDLIVIFLGSSKILKIAINGIGCSRSHTCPHVLRILQTKIHDLPYCDSCNPNMPELGFSLMLLIGMYFYSDGFLQGKPRWLSRSSVRKVVFDSHILTEIEILSLHFRNGWMLLPACNLRILLPHSLLLMPVLLLMWNMRHTGRIWESADLQRP